MRTHQNARSQVIIATANVHFGDAIRVDGGLESLRPYQPDILLLQEVTNTAEELKRQLSKAGYSLIHFASNFGLAIAVRVGSGLQAVPDSARTHQLQKMGYIEYKWAQRFAKYPHQMDAHGMQAVKFKTPSGQVVTVVNTRTTVSSNRIARKRQVTNMGIELADPYYAGLLVVGGDMNHFPGPGRIDRVMRQKAGLKQVDLGNQPTWRARNSKLYRTIARVRRQPLESLYAQLDTLLYRGGCELIEIKVVDILSDHRAIVGKFEL